MDSPASSLEVFLNSLQKEYGKHIALVVSDSAVPHASPSNRDGTVSSHPQSYPNPRKKNKKATINGVGRNRVQEKQQSWSNNYQSSIASSRWNNPHVPSKQLCGGGAGASANGRYNGVARSMMALKSPKRRVSIDEPQLAALTEQYRT